MYNMLNQGDIMTNQNLDERTLLFADYILENNCTIRTASKFFNIPKSTIHNNLQSRLKYIDYSKYIKLQKLLDENFNTKHIHGGESTKLKYLALKKEINKNDLYEIKSKKYIKF